jgi:hypothetical protein
MKRKILVVAVAAAIALAAGSLRASDQIGVYALITKVVLEPNDTSPTAAQVWGAFTIAVPNSWGSLELPAGGFGNPGVGDVYGPVQVGYLYYGCSGQPDAVTRLIPTEVDARCANEWRDLKSVAGTGKVVGFGARHALMAYPSGNGRVRPPAEAAARPDVYPVSGGIVPIGFAPAVPWDIRRPGRPPIAQPRPYDRMIAALAAALEKK